MNVSLIRVTENPVLAIEQAASNCYDSTPSADGKIMNDCYESMHHSVLEFATFHFHIEGVSRSLLAQLTRHRMASFAVRSQRYVNEDNFEYVIPDSIQNDPGALIVYNQEMKRIKDTYQKLCDGYNIPKEDARYVLPNACNTVVDVSMNLRSLIHFMNERLCSRAQWEIRELAIEMKRIVIEMYPQFKDILVPKCEIHKDYPFCTEKKSCGRHDLLMDVYKGGITTVPVISAKKPSGSSMKKLKNTYLILGRSGSGKDSLVDALCEKYGCVKLKSYTTRPPRQWEKDTHIFVNEDEFDNVMNDHNDVCAYTYFNGHHYCATADQVKNSDFYIIDPAGLDGLKEYLNQYNEKLNIIAIGIEVPAEQAIKNMIDRGDQQSSILQRVQNDFETFARLKDKVDKVFYNEDFDVCVEEVWSYIQDQEPKCKHYTNGFLPVECLQCPNGSMDDGALYCLTDGQLKQEGLNDNKSD